MEKRTVIRKQIRFLMYGRGLTTKHLAKKANLSVSHTRNLISGVYSSAPGREKIEAALGYPIWSDQGSEDSSPQTALGEQEPGQ